jgi:hypothetical protein
MKILDMATSLFGGKKREQLTLSQLVTLLADEPTTKNRNAFYHCLLSSKVGTRILNPDGYIKSGVSVTTKENPIKIPTATGPDGITMILVYCDIPKMLVANPKDAFVELDGRVVLEMAEKEGFGIVVQNALDGKESWAGVPKEHVADILSNKYENA